MAEALLGSELEKFAEIAYLETGIRISLQKLELMNNRLGRRMKKLDLSSFKIYYEYLVSNASREMSYFIEAITTNETYFFRCPRHFSLLGKTVFPGIKSDSVDIWSAASSTGEEPYSLAIALNERLPNANSRQFRVFGSDIDTSVLKKATRGKYNAYALRLVPPDLLSKYFTPCDNKEYQIKANLRKQVLYGKHNLKLPFPKGQVDIVFCRNVLIYFDDASKKIVFQQLLNALKPGGYLFLGESELIPDLPGIKRIEASVAQKVA